MLKLPRRLALAAVLSMPFAGTVEAGSGKYMASWEKLPPAQQAIFEPIHANWEKLPYKQRLRLMRVAAKYSDFTPAQKERFDERLRQWTNLTRAERDRIRDRQASFAKLPKDQREKLAMQYLSGRAPVYGREETKLVPVGAHNP
jgi:hypothetical protein